MKTLILAALLAFAPPEKRPTFPGYHETSEARLARYDAIAADIEEASDGPSSAALLVAMAIGETGLALDADRGPCYRGGVFTSRCDYGRAATLWQMHAGRYQGEPFTVGDLFTDRRRAAGLALWALRSSLRMCHRLAPEDRLSQYGAGTCQKGIEQVRARYYLWMRVEGWIRRYYESA